MPTAAPPLTGAGDLTAEWLSAALGTVVTGVTLEPVGTGQVADTVRIGVDYAEAGTGPATVIAKVPAAEEASRAGARLTRTYEIEASFYRDLAPGLPVRTPHCHHAAHDPETDAYVVLLEDVAPATQGDQMAGCTVEDIAAAVDELALLHGPRWGDASLLDLDWLHRAKPEQLAATVDLVGYTVGPFHEQYRDLVTPQTMDVLDELTPHLGAYLRHRPEPWTIVHGDFRADNLLFGGPRVVVVDWQTVGVGPAAGDLSYLLGASLTPELRRRHEGELVDRYVGRLGEQGVAVDRDALWEGYRRWAFGGLIMAVAASALVRRTARGDEMFITMADRHAQQAIDLESLSLVARQPPSLR
ncbi:MAG: phosphotransferase [Ilumatobacteraceae bacterium]